MNLAPKLRATIDKTRVRGVWLYHMPWLEDHQRGHLTVGNFEVEIPFVPRRYFITFGVPEEENRGQHAHRDCSQFLLCVYGSCKVLVDDGDQREEHLLDNPTVGILVPPMIWSSEFDHSIGSRLLVFASHYYDPGDYIRDHAVFLEAVKKRRGRAEKVDQTIFYTQHA